MPGFSAVESALARFSEMTRRRVAWAFMPCDAIVELIFKSSMVRTYPKSSQPPPLSMAVLNMRICACISVTAVA